MTRHHTKPLLCLAMFPFAAALPSLSQVPAAAASVPPAAVVSPGAAYLQAMRPFEVARRSMANWSATEQAAFAVAVREAGSACKTTAASTFTGDDLLDQARLCSIGLDYTATMAALKQFIESEPESPRLVDAYALQADTALHLGDRSTALQACNHLLEQPTYGRLASAATDELIDYTETLYTADAIAIAEKRQPLILARLAASKASAPGSAPKPDEVDRPTLYRDGLRLASLQQLSNRPEAAARTLHDLDGALGVKLSADEAASIAAARAPYALLNKPLPRLDGARYLLPGKAPALHAQGTVTALLLFPDWCAQCVQMARDMPQGVFWVQKHAARAYSLLAETTTQTPLTGKPEDLQPGSFNPALAEQYLARTSSFRVEPQLLSTWAPADIPLLVVADAHGIVRFAEAVDESAIQPGKTLDSVVLLIDKTWPAPAGSAAPVGTTKAAGAEHSPHAAS